MSYRSRRGAVVFALAAAALASSGPACAQLFWKSPDFRTAPTTGPVPALVVPLPGATPAEMNADIVWTLRSGLNVAALQCQFAPVLMTVRNYNDVLTDHAKELASDYKTLEGYFTRTTPKSAGKAAALAAMDRYSTQTYNSFSTLRGQLGFCQTASQVALDALMAPKGGLLTVARDHLQELRNSLVPVGDYLWQQQPPPTLAQVDVPQYPADCFDKKGRLTKQCLKEYGPAS